MLVFHTLEGQNLLHRAILNIHSLRRLLLKSDMHRTLLAALVPLALGDDAPTMAPTISAAPTRTDTYYPSYTYITLQHATRNKHRQTKTT